MNALPMHVAVLKGGRSAEREVSLSSGAACSQALAQAGYRVTQIDAAGNLAHELETVAPDVVFNALHGRFGEDGCVQGMLEIMGLPYTHSGVRASALAMDKPRAKTIFAACGVPVVPGVVARVDAAAARHLMEPPYVVKPTDEGSSVGVHIVRPGDNQYPESLRAAWPPERQVLLERYVPGRELTVAVLDGRALAVTEIVPAAEFYDYDAKYAAGGSRHVVPAQIPPVVEAAARELAVKAHEALGCRGVSRTDLRWDDRIAGAGGLFVLEINTQPGMTPTSLLPEQAAYAGMDFPSLVRWMVEDASCGR